MSSPDFKFIMGSVFGAVLSASCCWAAPVIKEVPLAKDRADSESRLQRSTQSAYLGDLSEDKGGSIFAGNFKGPAGRYRLHASMAVHPLNSMATAWLAITLKAGGNAESSFNSLTFAAPDEFIDLAMDFTAVRGDNPVTVSWGFEGKDAKVSRTKSIVAPTAPVLGGDGAGEKDIMMELEDKNAPKPLERASSIATCLMLREIHAEPLSPVAISSVRSDKITYKRGEQGQVMVQLANAAPAAQAVTLNVEVQGGLDQCWPIRTETITVPAGGTLVWKGEFDTKPLAWGCAIKVTATVPGFPPETGKAIFAVPDHFWDVAIMATCPAQMTKDFSTMERARQAAAKLKDEGFNGFEAYFWAPCDLLEYTPDTETFYSGQTAYIQRVTGTRNLIAACHELGIKATFYANLWGGSGEPAFEIMRQHPDWFGSANFHSGALDDAPLQTAGIIQGVGHKVWSYNQLNAEAGMGLFDYHIGEILGTRKMFGWDGIRYDSYYSAAWTIKAMTHIRGRMNQEAPDFLFGYNAFAGAEYNVGAMDSLSNGMIMAEGARVGPGSNISDFLRGLNGWREVSWPYGSAIGPLYGFTGGKEGAKPTPLDHILLSSVYMSVGGHPYYNLMGGGIGEYPAFAVRYAEIVYNTRLRDVDNPDQVVAFGNQADPQQWRELLRTCTVAEGRQRLVLHVMNVAKDTVLGALDMRHLPPLRKAPVRFTLPAGAKPVGAWLLQAYPAVSQQALPVTTEGSFLSVTLPEVRFYGVVVFDVATTTPIPVKVDAKARRKEVK